MSIPADAIPVAPLTDLDNGPKVVRGNHHNIVVFSDEGKIFAVDNRCPHMGFPLDRGSVKDGILTCHWHQARFDLASGCTFDIWADDVLKFDTFVEDGNVLVAPDPRDLRDASFYRRRLIQGMEQDIGLVQAKSLLSLLETDGDLAPLLEAVLQYASENLNQISEGLTRLGCISNLYPKLDRETTYQGLLYATRKIANETTSAVPYRTKNALSGSTYDHAQLKAWLHQWVQTRHADGTERTLLTGVNHSNDTDLADLVFSVASQRLYANGGHLLEDCNKVFQLSPRLSQNGAEKLFPLLVNGLTQSRGEEESTNWHHPVEIVDPLELVDAELPAILNNNRGNAARPEDLLTVLLGDDPLAIIDNLKQSLIDDVSPAMIAREVSYAAALRLARFATSNEVTDWFNPQHTYIHSNAAYQAVNRSPTPEVVRTVFQTAISVYMDRFLNVPPARLPSEKNSKPTLPTSPAELLEQLLLQLDQRASIDEAAGIVSRYLSLNLEFDALINTLALATVREDLDFHSLQVLDAATQQAAAWDDQQIIENIMVGVVRNLAAHCPTRRAGQQTAKIAAKLQRGELIYEG
ncbi:MAG: Rieske (2Fe-2S) protein [Gammaproteobacteria bacterium]|nr:Rieske (2Fe-2S) protein [Gammaproteobacteria bacterium]